MSYTRVIPRDLFNEAKLLKCLGQLALLIHDNKVDGLPLVLDHQEPETGFQIAQNRDSGDLYCANLDLYFHDETVSLSIGYNSRHPYPLYFWHETGDGKALTDEGQLAPEFIAFLEQVTQTR